MSQANDPFAHHPELRAKITDPLQSFFRNVDIKDIFRDNPELNWVLDELHTDEIRNESRRKALESHDGGDLWIFAYGSLMWDPAMVFSQVRRAVVPNYERRFILKEVWGARGTLETPGVFAALDKGDGCEGLAYHIAQKNIDTETRILWRREMVGSGYVPKFVTALIDNKPVPVLTFVADYTAKNIQPNLTHDEQVEFLATGTGVLGSSLDYLKNIVSQFATLNVVDEHCSKLLRDAKAYIPQRNAGT